MATDGPRTDGRAQLLERARRTIVAVGQAVHGKDTKSQIQTDAGTLLAIGEVMALMLEDMHACGGTQCMGRAIDGIKLWVTQDQFNAAQKRAVRLEDALRRIATDAGHDEAYDMLVDWRETTSTLRRLARNSLDDAG